MLPLQPTLYTSATSILAQHKSTHIAAQLFNSFLRTFSIKFEFQDPSQSEVASTVAPETFFHTCPYNHPKQLAMTQSPHDVMSFTCGMHIATLQVPRILQGSD